jgi:hypothetical protein
MSGRQVCTLVSADNADMRRRDVEGVLVFYPSSIKAEKDTTIKCEWAHINTNPLVSRALILSRKQN